MAIYMFFRISIILDQPLLLTIYGATAWAMLVWNYNIVFCFGLELCEWMNDHYTRSVLY